VDDEKKLNDVFKEVEALHRVFTTNPVFGVDVGEVRGSARDDALQRNDSSRSNVNTEEDDDVEIIDSRESGTDLMRKYYAEIAAGSDGYDVSTLEPVFDETLGLAIEPLPQGATTTGLWNIV
jgi:Bardet-Biedl syndrome 5 protein|tara:strand:- start:3063 stop:3428 length:366 start_codon:yes stop_codon:yes gene_type:complete